MPGWSSNRLCELTRALASARSYRSAKGSQTTEREERFHRSGDRAVAASPAVGAVRAGRSCARLVMVAPRITSECPARNLVTLCTTTSAPCSSGRCPSGVAKVLSTATSTLRSCAPRQSARRSATSRSGLVGDSTNRRSAPSHASRVASVSAMSTNLTVQRPSGTAEEVAGAVVRVDGCDDTPPIGTSSSTAIVAAMPEANARARPPSSAPSASSKAVQVGLPSRP